MDNLSHRLCTISNLKGDFFTHFGILWVSESQEWHLKTFLQAVVYPVVQREFRTGEKYRLVLARYLPHDANSASEGDQLVVFHAAGPRFLQSQRLERQRGGQHKITVSWPTPYCEAHMPGILNETQTFGPYTKCINVHCGWLRQMTCHRQYTLTHKCFCPQHTT